MSIISYNRVDLTDRKYVNHQYRIERYERSGKINVRVFDNGQSVFLKMSLEETKDLITYLQYAVHEAENG